MREIPGVEGEADLAWAAEAALGVPVSFSLGRALPPMDALSPREAEHLAGFALAKRRDEWRRGRGALKALLRALGESEDTSDLRFPHPRFSLTHAGGLAMAAARRDAAAAGLGVDYESPRPMRLDSARFFLDAGEREKLGLPAAAGAGADPAGRILLRLWTVKEALFKADLGNAGRVLRQYRLHDPAAAQGEATGPDGGRYRYASFEFGEGFLSAAIRIA